MKLYRFPFSCYARYVQAAIDLCRVPCEVIDVVYGDRNELATITGGTITVPVVVRDDGTVLNDSRLILETLIREDVRFASLVPAADAAPIWAYADWAASLLEDVAFRLSCPGLTKRFPTAFERALFVFSKERKFGRGCIDQWERDADTLFAWFEHMLIPTRTTLARRPYLFGDAPTLADAALYGQFAMLDFGAPDRVAALGTEILEWKSRIEARLGPPPYGRVATHRPTRELDERLRAQRDATRTSKLEWIVLRTEPHARACPKTAELVVGGGILGDRWGQSPLKPTNEVSLMDVRVAAAIAQKEDWELFGDNLFVDFDLSISSLSPKDRFRVGKVLLEMTDEPHHGCRKFSARFGPEALRWVNHKSVADERRRGIFARVVQGGTIELGDVVVRA